MALIAYQDIGYSGAAVTFGAVTASDHLIPDPNGFLWVKNGSGVSINVTVQVGGSTFGQNHADVVVAVPAGQERLFGPALENLAGADTFGVVVFGFSATTSITAAGVRLLPPSQSLPI